MHEESTGSWVERMRKSPKLHTGEEHEHSRRERQQQSGEVAAGSEVHRISLSIWRQRMAAQVEHKRNAAETSGGEAWSVSAAGGKHDQRG